MKILINSYPRSGTQTFRTAIFQSMNKQDIDWGDRLLYNDNWVHASYIPVLFYSNFEGKITMATILRDPIEAISSNVFRFVNGYYGNIVNDKIVLNPSQFRGENNFDEEIKKFTDEEIKQYLSYYTCILLNYKNMEMFSYEDIKNNPVECVRYIIKSAGGDYENIDTGAIEYSMNHPFVPSLEKTKLYFDIKEYISKSPLIHKCYKIYEDLMPNKANIYSLKNS